MKENPSVQWFIFLNKLVCLVTTKDRAHAWSFLSISKIFMEVDWQEVTFVRQKMIINAK